jgi:hypothetical protein
VRETTGSACVFRVFDSGASSGVIVLTKALDGNESYDWVFPVPVT